MRRKTLFMGVCFLAQACGGDGGSDAGVPVVSAPAPAPTPAPSASPSPTSSTAAGPTLSTLQTSEALPGWSGSNGYHRNAGGAVSYAQDLSIGAGSPVRYDATDGRFTFLGLDYLIPAERRGPVTFAYERSLSTTSYAEYQASSNGVSYRFTELSRAGGNPTLQLDYAGLAIIRSDYLDAAEGVTKHAVTPISYGILYDWGKVKLTGTATYDGVLLGHARGVGSRVYDVRGTIRLNIDYDTTLFSGRITLIGTDDRTGRVVDLGSLAITTFGARGALDFFSGSTPFDGRLQARLAGALGQELTGGFDAIILDPQVDGVRMKLSVALAAKK